MSNRIRQGPGILLLWFALVLAVSLLLAVQSFRAYRSHRRAADSVLEDYAQLAAHELRDRLDFRFAVYTCGAVARFAPALDRQPPGEPVPSPAELADGVSETLQRALATVRSIHRYDFASGGFEPSPPEAAAAIADAVEGAARAGTDESRGWAYVQAGGSGAVVTVVRDEDGTPRRAWVFVLLEEEVRATVQAIAGIAPLLPEFLLGGTDPADWLGWWVVAPDGREVAAAGAGQDAAPGPATASWTAEEPTEAFLGLVVRTRILGPAAAVLVPGGVPHSNLALTVALLVLSVTLLLGAYLQLRREAELTRLREDFLAGISHELRTPLAQIRMFAETLRLGRVRSEREGEQSLEILVRESQRLSHLVDNVLVDSRSTRGILRAVPQRTDLSRHLAEVADEFAPLAEARGARLRRRIAPGLVRDVDGELLRHAVINLLDNAVKFGPQGQTVTIGGSGGDSGVRIWVEDEGPGIPAADRGRVCERFFRLDRDRDGAIAGTGIGLAVVRDVARLHGGAVEIESAERGGARVVLLLPDDGGSAR